MHTDTVKYRNPYVGRRVLSLAVAVAFILGVFVSPAIVGISVAEPSSGTLSIAPPSAEVSVGGTTSVDVRSDGISNIYGAQFTVAFDPAYLQVVDADGNAGNGVQISPGDCPAPDFVATNSVDNATGTVDYAVTQLNPTAACDGGVIATIQFQCQNVAGTFPVTISSSILSDPDGTSMAHSAQNGEIVCLENIFTITGQALAQGQPGDASGVEVCLDGTQCVAAEADGSFTFTALASEAHAITADAGSHLLAEQSGITGNVGDMVDIGRTTLRAGDLNGDGTINILDLVMAGGNFGNSEPFGW